jgi:hypothetical protein
MITKNWVYDLETLMNCFIGVFESYTTDERHVFVVHSTRNDLPKLIDFLTLATKNKNWLFGYNNLAFDSQIIEYILQHKSRLLKCKGEDVSKEIYQYSQQVIKKSNTGEFADYPEWKLTLKQLDIFKLNHWDNDAKRSSLKWIQYSMDWYNVEEMPHPHYKPVVTTNDVVSIIKYCINDVSSTKAIFRLPEMKQQIALRASLSKEYGLNLYSASEPRISKEMFIHFLSEKLKVDRKNIKDLRTLRDSVKIKGLILDYVKFKTPEFCNMFAWFKSLDIEVTEGKMQGPKHTMIHKGVKTDYGLGGLHGCTAPGIYESTDTHVIMSVDVASFYPNLAIRNRWSPEHIPKEPFCELYEWFYKTRKKYDKKNPLNYLFKIILNSTYGLSKNKHSFLYDPELTFRITMNGQLLLSMLYEQISLAIPEAEPIMQNTDGLEFIIPRDKIEIFTDVCAEWEKMTQLTLETDTYKRMIIRDVNNYIAVYTDITKKPKCKGVFEWENLPLHKNKSFLVVTKAIYHYFVHGLSPEEYLETNKNIFDYCGGVKIKGDWHFLQRRIVEGKYKEEHLQKLIRYYISETGVKLFKKHSDGREIQIEAGKWVQKVFNKFADLPFEKYGIDKRYYLEQITQEIENIEGSAAEKAQLSLF